jgi:mono/diheme cytochrome c family protein
MGRFFARGEDMKLAVRSVSVLVIALSLSFLYAKLPADKEKGKEVYAKGCQSCHGEKGEAKPGIAKMFPTIRPLGSKEVLSKTDDELVKYILKPTGKMPPAKLSNAEAADVIAYLREFAAAKK